MDQDMGRGMMGMGGRARQYEDDYGSIRDQMREAEERLERKQREEDERRRKMEMEASRYHDDYEDSYGGGRGGFNDNMGGRGGGRNERGRMERDMDDYEME